MPTMLPVVMIVGCSRSGTSFTARMLASAGLLFPGEHTAADEFNRDGYFEADRVVAINSDILWGSNGHWFAPPRRLRVYAYQRAQIIQAFAWFASFPGLSGWKDPRGTLTLPVWLDVARDLNIPVHVVGVFRNPAAVANSIVRHERGTLDFSVAFDAWCIHNTRLLNLAAALPYQFSWFTIDQSEQDIEANLNAIAAKMGLPGRVSVGLSKAKARPDTERLEVSPTADALYNRLRAAHAAWCSPSNSQPAVGSTLSPWRESEKAEW